MRACVAAALLLLLLPPPVLPRNSDAPDAAIASLARVRDALHEELSTLAAAAVAAAGRTSIEGHSGQSPSQSDAYLELALAADARIIVELGFNAGHSMATWLLGSPRATQAVGFDLGRHPYVIPARDMLNARFKPRSTYTVEAAAPGVGVFDASTAHLPDASSRVASVLNDTRSFVTLVQGDTLDTVPYIAGLWRRFNLTADLIHVDAYHYGRWPMLDLLNARTLAHARTLLVLDDVYAGCPGHPDNLSCSFPTAAWEALVAAGVIVELGRGMVPALPGRGWAVGHYVTPERPLEALLAAAGIASVDALVATAVEAGTPRPPQ